MDDAADEPTELETLQSRYRQPVYWAVLAASAAIAWVLTELLS